MSNISVDYDVLNQRGSPAWFTDTFANIPTAGYVGRMFISKDTFAFYRDTGTGWDLIGGPGIGTLTGSGVVGQVSFFNGTQVLAGNNNLFWDNTNSRLGINTTTPGQPLDIHSTGNTLVQLNNTTTANSNISFQNQNVAKWRVGNVYNAGANSFNIENANLLTNALTISSTTNNITLTGALSVPTLSVTNVSTLDGNILLKKAGIGVTSPTYVSQFAASSGVGIGYSDGTGGANFTFPTASISTYTFPATTGTLALTSDLSSYLPLTGGTLTGALVINPTNTAIVGLDVASNTTRFRSDNLEGFKRQLEITMGSGTLVQLTAKGYGANYGTDLAFYTATTGGTNASPGIYITGTNNRVGIGTGSPTATLDVNGEIRMTGSTLFRGMSSNTLQLCGGTSSSNILINGSTEVITMSTNGADRMVISSGGYISVNGGSNYTGTGCVNTSVSTSADFCYSGLNTNASNPRGVYLNFPNTTAGDFAYYLQASGAQKFYVTGNGVIYSTSAVVNVIASDYNLKTDIKDYDKGLNEILKMKPRYFKYKDNLEIKESGFIAQEMDIAVPGSMTDILNSIDSNDTHKSYKIDWYPILVKAIQELNEKLVRNNIN